MQLLFSFLSSEKFSVVLPSAVFTLQPFHPIERTNLLAAILPRGIEMPLRALFSRALKSTQIIGVSKSESSESKIRKWVAQFHGLGYRFISLHHANLNKYRRPNFFGPSFSTSGDILKGDILKGDI